MIARTLLLAPLAFALAPTALAGNCDADGSDSPIATTTCSTGAAGDVCQSRTDPAGNWVWDCGASRNLFGGVASNATVTLVTGYDAGEPTKITAWGTDSTGTAFCCATTDTTFDRVELVGGGGNDTLSFYDATSGLSLEPNGAVLNEGMIAGRNGNDTITGSDYDPGLGGGYIDRLHGDRDADTIDGQDGPDLLYGDDHADTLDGGPGDDTIRGGPGDDDIYGGDDNDQVNAGGGVDHVYGENGNDILCTDVGGGVEYANGGAGDDVLYDSDGSLGGDGGTNSGTWPNDTCEAGPINCETPIIGAWGGCIAP